ncbi:hypothetical protein VNO77_16941 [Canavalia gladiata]|uniref:Transmembrane protein n=1 Tax=Canavalia gladiata TaxID=3824 RepID=A0AAN9LIT6_CANGL
MLCHQKLKVEQTNGFRENPREEREGSKVMCPFSSFFVLVFLMCCNFLIGYSTYARISVQNLKWTKQTGCEILRSSLHCDDFNNSYIDTDRKSAKRKL